MPPGTRKILAYGAALALLAAVFVMYTRPALLVSLADQFWACFN